MDEKHDKHCPWCDAVLSNGEMAPVCFGRCSACEKIVRWDSERKRWQTMYEWAAKEIGRAIL